MIATITPKKTANIKAKTVTFAVTINAGNKFCHSLIKVNIIRLGLGKI